MALQTVATRRLYEQIATQIGDLIERGEYPPGTKLPPERDLAITLGVSRPTVREALIALEVTDLVEVKVGVGVFVRQHPGKNLRLPSNSYSPLEVMQARAMVEPGIAAMAATSISEETTARLEACLRILSEATELDQWSEMADRDLHLCLANHCGNKLLQDIVHNLWQERSGEMSAKWHQHLASVPGLLRPIMIQHEEIVRAVKEADPEQADAAMRRHLDHVYTEMQALWD